jgi:GFO/IDH/MocA oxidoreductase family protein
LSSDNFQEEARVDSSCLQEPLRQAAKDARLGRVVSAVCNTLWLRPSGHLGTVPEYRHQLGLMLTVLGEWTSVVAVASRRTRRTATEDLSGALVTFEDGTIANVVSSSLAAREVNYLRFDFEHATVEVDGCSQWKLTAVPGREGPVAQAWDESLRLAHACDGHHPGPETLELLDAVQLSATTGQQVERKLGARN